MSVPLWWNDSGLPVGVQLVAAPWREDVLVRVAAQLEAQIGYKAVSWQEANSDLIGTFAVRDFIMMTVMAAMLLVSSFATYNIISTITYEKRHDIALLERGLYPRRKGSAGRQRQPAGLFYARWRDGAR